MTHPLPRWLRVRGAAAAAAGLVGTVVATGLGVGPAGAGPATPGCNRVGASAAGDAVTVRLLDLRPLGVALGRVAGVNLAVARAGLTGGAGRSAADAEYVRARTLGFKPPTGPFDTAVSQQAPPADQLPAVFNAGQVDLGVARAGGGELRAHADYRDTGRCDLRAGARAEASAGLVEAAVLPAAGGRALASASALRTTGRTGLVSHRGGAGTEAVSTAALADVSLLSTVAVRAVSQPSLRVVAGGSRGRSAVEYAAPVFEVALPGGRRATLNGATGALDIAVPTPGSSPMEGVATLPGDPLTDILGALPALPGARPGALPGGTGRARGSADGSADVAGGTATVEGGADAGGEVAAEGNSPAPPGLPGLGPLPLPDLPGLGTPPGGSQSRGNEPGEGESGGNGSGGNGSGGRGGPARGSGASLVLRLTVGELTKEINDDGVHAKAISLRVRLLLVRSGGGYGGHRHSTLVDLCVGVLETAATAPRGGHGGPDGDNGGGTGGESTGGGNGGSAGGQTGGHESLPVTGKGLALLLGAAVTLLTSGRLLMILARRRATGLPG